MNESKVLNTTEGKGKLRAAIFTSAKTVHLILLCYLGNAIRSAVSVDLR